MPKYRLRPQAVTAIQWQPEQADAIIEELIAAGVDRDSLEINGDHLVIWELSSPMGKMLYPGAWGIVIGNRLAHLYEEEAIEWLEEIE